MGWLETLVGTIGLYVYFYAYFIRDAAWIGASIALVLAHTACMVLTDREKGQSPSGYDWLSGLMICGALPFIVGPIFVGQVAIFLSAVVLLATGFLVRRMGKAAK
ncbi:hypothetical protein ACFO5Q_16415 [Kordiimonas lipolytica]|uniref:SPW repeat-containing protein n=1 Tax=Kordiimonas lipolytica TaxID=1662421 RepID=A0ABV8UG32_9PROT|nr:hypothetical protein [Kordiimonas lipolytica]